MKLSVIIVNYNVKHFLEQCLHAALKATRNLSAEIFVVDNNSVDGSCHLVREKFPTVKLIENSENVGYAAANNQAIRQAAGEYILLLNPDTVVEEDTFEKTTGFMDAHPEAGGLGVKMIDGKGKFLPESKRGLPVPWVAFYKIFGLSRLFPHSRKFGKYHLTYLDENQTHPVDVLCGAFMLLRRETLNQTGLLDEAFFMYGEDIDLSYRILQAGYRNYYFPESTIIHYKGESTKKGSINYVRIFYNAMLIFARKHFSTGNARFYSVFIHLAIYFRALLAIVQRLLRKVYLPLSDALLTLAGFSILLPLWETIKFEPGYYPPFYRQVVVPAYLLIWLAAIFLSGGYRRPVNLLRLVRGLLWGTVAILIAYSLIDERYRFSRALILLGSAWALAVLPLFRIFFSRLRIKGFELDIEKQKRIAIVGHIQEASRVKALLLQTPVRSEIAGYISVAGEDTGEEYLGTTAQLREIIRINRIDEIIFCAENLSSGEIIRAMLDLTSLEVTYKIAPPESYSIIGSNSIHTAGDLYLVDINAISKKENRRKKRIFDLAATLFFMLNSFWLIWFFRRKSQFLKNLAGVLKGGLSWVGYLPLPEQTDLPQLRPGIVNPGSLFCETELTEARKRQLNILYAKDYRLINDLELVARSWKLLDQKPDE